MVEHTIRKLNRTTGGSDAHFAHLISIGVVMEAFDASGGFILILLVDFSLLGDLYNGVVAW